MDTGKVRILLVVFGRFWYVTIGYGRLQYGFDLKILSLEYGYRQGWNRLH